LALRALAPFLAATVTAAVAAPARADSPDGYCELVEGSAAAESDLLYAPTLFGSAGYVKSPTVTSGNEPVTAGGRLVAGVSYNFAGILQGNAKRERARADCRRHQALDRVQGETLHKALGARLAVYDDALAEADRVLTRAVGDLKARRGTAQEVVALRLRVNELHDLAADARRQLEALPAPSSAGGGALAAYYQADDDIEAEEGRLRRLAGVGLEVRAGYDQYLDRADSSPIFALVTLSLNLGTLFQGDANDRAAEGRRHMIREQHLVQLVDATLSHLRAELESDRQRSEETAALASDLEAQLAQLDKIPGDESRRYRQTVWFDWVKVHADHAYYETHAASLREVLGEVGP
jgi:hypothetical protein